MPMKDKSVNETGTNMAAMMTLSVGALFSIALLGVYGSAFLVLRANAQLRDSNALIGVAIFNVGKMSTWMH